jgi:hypothetical protein
MIRPLRIDTDKAGAIAAEALEQRPKLAGILARPAGEQKAWRIVADLLPGDRVLLSVRAPSGHGIALWEGPRVFVELDAPREELH